MHAGKNQKSEKMDFNNAKTVTKAEKSKICT